jgi:hypothetical protein
LDKRKLRCVHFQQTLNQHQTTHYKGMHCIEGDRPLYSCIDQSLDTNCSLERGVMLVYAPLSRQRHLEKEPRTQVLGLIALPDAIRMHISNSKKDPGNIQ